MNFRIFCWLALNLSKRDLSRGKLFEPFALKHKKTNIRSHESIFDHSIIFFPYMNGISNMQYNQKTITWKWWYKNLQTIHLGTKVNRFSCFTVFSTFEGLNKRTLIKALFIHWCFVFLKKD